MVSFRGAWRAGAVISIQTYYPIDLSNDKNYNSHTREPKTRTHS